MHPSLPAAAVAVLLALAACLAVVVLVLVADAGHPWRRRLRSAVGQAVGRLTSAYTRRHLAQVRRWSPPVAHVPLCVTARRGSGVVASVDGDLAHPTLWDWLATAERRGWPPVLLVGPSGSGKSTLLAHAAAVIASRGRVAGGVAAPRRVPVVVPVGAYADDGAPTDLVALLESALSRSGRRPPAGWCATNLRKGRLALLVDDLDELSDAASRQLLRVLTEQAPEGTVVLVVSRRLPEDMQPDPALALRLRALDAGQAERFTQLWSQRVPAPDRADEPLLTRLRDAPELLRLAGNPLMLTVLCRIDDTGGPLPVDRTAALREGRGLDEQVARLRPLADLARAEAVAASGRAAELLCRIDDPRWRDVLVASASLGGAAPVVQACLADPPRADRLALALECARASRPERAGLEQAVADRLADLRRSRDGETRRAAVLAELRAACGDDVPLDVGRFLSPPVGWATYAVLREEQHPRGDGGAADRPVTGLGHREARALVEQLDEHAPGGYSYRLPTRSELEAARDDSGPVLPRAWSQTMTHSSLRSAREPALRAMAQRSRYLPFPRPGRDEGRAQDVRELLSDDVRRAGGSPASAELGAALVQGAALVEERPAQHGCDLEDVDHAAATVVTVLEESVRGSGPTDDRRELLERARSLRGLTTQLARRSWADATEADTQRRAARLHALSALALGAALDARESSAVSGAVLDGLAEILSELVGHEVAIRGGSAGLPQVLALRSAAPTALELGPAGRVSSWHRAKPAVECCLAALAALLLAPLLLAIVVAVRVDSAGPAFFVQTRVGKDGRLFRIYKFRSMVTQSVVVQPGLDEHGNVLFKDASDARVSRVGRWLRSTSLDELPQLFNVAQGVMALVGPRPFLPDETVLLEGSALERLAVRPGITGLWQVTGRGDLGWAESVALDSFYVRHCSPLLDLRILAGTPRAVLSRRGAY